MDAVGVELRFLVGNAHPTVNFVWNFRSKLVDWVVI